MSAMGLTLDVITYAVQKLPPDAAQTLDSVRFSSRVLFYRRCAIVIGAASLPTQASGSAAYWLAPAVSAEAIQSDLSLCLGTQ